MNVHKFMYALYNVIIIIMMRTARIRRSLARNFRRVFDETRDLSYINGKVSIVFDDLSSNRQSENSAKDEFPILFMYGLRLIMK